MTRASIRYLRRGRTVEVGDVAPNETLLDFLRLRDRSFGTKEGCAEGDCGACTVVLGAERDGKVHYEPVNACIQLLGTIDGKELVTVDDLAAGDDTLHPVQQAIVDRHGSQCGFCTPGMVMALFSLYHAGRRADRATVNDWLAGNLCRCTGYRPIVDAALASCTGKARDGFGGGADVLAGLCDGEDVFIGDDRRFFAAPASIDSLAALYARYPDATVVAGATDVGLWITKRLRDLPRIVHVGRAAGFDAVDSGGDCVVIGAGATYAQAFDALNGIDPDIGVLLRRLGSKQVRAVGTIGGNIANGSPIGDMPPVLIALGAHVDLRRGETTRTLPLEDFFIDYGKQDRAPGELVTAVKVPRPARNQAFRCYKVSKRFDQDISALLGAFRLTLEAGRVAHARIAFGGMAATPKRATATETAVVGLEPGERRAWRAAADALAEDFAPIDDMRASAAYRLDAARGLLIRAAQEIAGASSRTTRVAGIREGDLERVA